jgi:hypothetical protein
MPPWPLEPQTQAINTVMPIDLVVVHPPVLPTQHDVDPKIPVSLWTCVIWRMQYSTQGGRALDRFMGGPVEFIAFCKSDRSTIDLNKNIRL